jgi:hypothetical protein
MTGLFEEKTARWPREMEPSRQATSLVKAARSFDCVPPWRDALRMMDFVKIEFS